jgi:hypothetical protein
MRSFILGFLGMLTALVLAGYAYSMYGDYRSEAQSSAWFIELLPAMQEIEAQARQQNTLAGTGAHIGKATPRMTRVNFLRVEDQGTIIVRGGSDGQVIVLIPQFDKGNVSWRCIGGPSRAVLPDCRDQGKLIGPFSP